MTDSVRVVKGEWFGADPYRVSVCSSNSPEVDVVFCETEWQADYIANAIRKTIADAWNKAIEVVKQEIRSIPRDDMNPEVHGEQDNYNCGCLVTALAILSSLMEIKEQMIKEQSNDQ